jgi:alkanesulfonate monooxygenase SsuD/methylene tetrahydromethanopterin reductase-like flavin-dependent oxidoreductase (luciferase family)
MLFGLRFDLRNPAFSGVDMADRCRALLEMAEWADQRGCLYLSLSEHHGSEDGYLPSSLTMAAAVAARTTNVRIGINAIPAPFYDPLRLAEDAAVVDLISGGRLDLTVAGGYVQSEFDMFGLDPSERPARVRETIETLRAAWSGEPFEYRGRMVQVTPRPAQPGGPTILLGGSSEAAARRAARLADGFIPSEPQWWAPYREECLALGKPDPGPGMAATAATVVLAEDPDAAWPTLGPYFLHETNSYGTWKTEVGAASPYSAMVDVAEVRASGQYRILTPAAYVAELAASELPFAMLHPMVGGIPPELGWESLRLFEAGCL